MKKYKQVKAQSKKMREYNDCTVVATSIAARIPYNKAHDMLRLRGRKDRRGTNMMVMLDAVADAGCTIERITCPIQPNGSRYTAKTIGKAFPKGYFIIEYRGHVAAMINGEVQDWTDNRNHRVQNVFRITVPRGSRS